jgi:hypothetical protein
MVKFAFWIVLLFQQGGSPLYDLNATGESKPTVARIERDLRAGFDRVTKYFGAPFPKRFTVFVAHSRKELDPEAMRLWKMPPSEKWMVGMGGTEELILLSPDAWKTDAVEHDPNSTTEFKLIVAHELTHVFHAQVSRKRDLDGLDEMAWFVEGLAVVVSGQLEARHKGHAQAAIREGKAPTKLLDAWTGKNRYGVSGSIVAYVEHKWGRAKVVELMKATSNAKAMKMLGTTEEELLTGWRSSVAQRER